VDNDPVALLYRVALANETDSSKSLQEERCSL
jgi:hypothetical protein